MKLQLGLGAYAIRPGNRFYSSGSPHWAEISKRVLQKCSVSVHQRVSACSVQVWKHYGSCEIHALGLEVTLTPESLLALTFTTTHIWQLNCNVTWSAQLYHQKVWPTPVGDLSWRRLDSKKLISWSKDNTYHNKSYPNRTWTFWSTCTDRKLSLIRTDFTVLNLYCIKGALALFVLVSFSGYVC